MSWLRDLDDNLVNLDHVARLEVVEVEGGSHALVARFPQDEEPAAWIAEGTENDCRLKLEAAIKQLHLLRI